MPITPVIGAQGTLLLVEVLAPAPTLSYIFGNVMVVLRWKQGHSLCLQVFQHLIWDGARIWQHSNGTRMTITPVIGAQGTLLRVKGLAEA